MSDSQQVGRIEAVRRFTRFYTRKMGVLHEHLLDSPFSLTEGRVVYELAHHEMTTAAELAKELGLDPSYLSRILKELEKRELIARRPSQSDGRENLVTLTEQGQEGFALINARSQNEVAAMLDGVSTPDQQRLLDAMATIQGVLGDEPPHRVPFILRPHQPGDMGWIIHRHGILYSQEYRWDETFEALVAEIAAKFIQTFNADRERCWIAEKDGENVGCVLLVRESDEVAKLRLLLIEPKARGLGIGKRLVAECIRFAQLKGYRRITLWTNDVLVAARHIYEAAGFKLIKEEPHRSFGHDLVGQHWNLEL